MSNKVEIRYCAKCKWMMRSAWMGQELLSTFDSELDELSLQPGTGGIFEIIANGKRIWCRKEKGGFPEIVELKRLVRDVIAPEKGLGHLDRKGNRT